MTTTTTLDLGACPSCGAPRHLGDDPARPGRPAVVTDHRAGCAPALPVAGHGCKHRWVALPTPDGFPQVWLIERCRTCGTAHVVRNEYPAPKEITTMTDTTTTPAELALRVRRAVAAQNGNDLIAALTHAADLGATTPLIVELAREINAVAPLEQR